MSYCSKPSCRGTAAVVLAYSYADRKVLLADVPDDGRPPQTYSLCLTCADNLSAPRGWDVDDRRERPVLFAFAADD